MEVADDTLDFDRHCKGQLYALAGIADYWIVNLIVRQLEVYRDPTPEGRYQEVRFLGSDETVCPVAFPDTEMPVSVLLPPMPGVYGFGYNGGQ